MPLDIFPDFLVLAETAPKAARGQKKEGAEAAPKAGHRKPETEAVLRPCLFCPQRDRT